MVIGARTAEQLADNLAAVSLVLGDDGSAQLDQVSAPPLIYPYCTRPRPPATVCHPPT